MRKRYRKPKIQNRKGYWIVQYRDQNGEKQFRSLGPVTKVKKYEAEEKLAKILAPINTAVEGPSPDFLFTDFLERIYLPFYRRKWKGSTASTNGDRVRHHLIERFPGRELGSFAEEEWQDFLDEMAKTHSYSTVAHLRWDLRQIFRLAVAKGYLARNPAELLFVPQEAKRPEKPVMDLDQVRRFFSVLDLRERTIGGLAILAGMRPGEIFALKRSMIQAGRADIRQRIYRGQIDTPKTFKSKRWAALGTGLMAWLEQWMEMIPGDQPDAWVFPSEKVTTPLSKDNCWRRSFLPRLEQVGLEWANFQVMRRTHSTLTSELDIAPEVRADQMGHNVDVNQNCYTQVSHARRSEAVNRLEDAVGPM